MADQCRDAPKVKQRLLDEDGLLVDVDFALRPDKFSVVLTVERSDSALYTIEAAS
jgi:hypothetical protein